MGAVGDCEKSKLFEKSGHSSVAAEVKPKARRRLSRSAESCRWCPGRALGV